MVDDILPAPVRLKSDDLDASTLASHLIAIRVRRAPAPLAVQKRELSRTH